jgi:uncharacterized protein DUF2628
MTPTGKIVVLFIAASAGISVLWYLIRTARFFAGVRSFLDTPVEVSLGAAPDPATTYYRDYPGRLNLNVPALILGPFWYLATGLWAHAAIMFTLVGLSGGLLAPIAWLYCGLKANEDLLEFRVARDSVY